MHYHITDIQADFEINRPVRYQITTKRNYFHRRTDRRTDRRRVRQQYVVFLKKKNTKNELFRIFSKDQFLGIAQFNKISLGSVHPWLLTIFNK